MTIMVDEILNRRLAKLAKIRLAKTSQEIVKEVRELAGHVPKISRASLQDPNRVELLRLDYEEMGREIRTNSTLAWAIGSIFLGGSFVIFGTTLTSEIPPMSSYVRGQPSP